MEDCIKVSPLARDRAPTSCLVTPLGTRAQRLAGILAHLTGRLILSDQPAWVLFQHEAQFLVTYMAAPALARADRSWLARLVSRLERPEDFARALQRQPDDIKVVVQFAAV